MRRATFKCVGTEPLLFGKQIVASKRPDETNEQLEERTWLDRCTVNESGNLAIPGYAMQRSLVWSGAWLNEKIKGENRKTYTKRFDCGVMPEHAFFELSNGKTILRPSDCEKFPLYVPSRGTRGKGGRVWKSFPRLKAGWWFLASILIIDEAISDDVFGRHVHNSALYDGMGSMRHGTGGQNGRYVVENLKFDNVT